MANLFKSYTDTAIGTSESTAYTVPSATVAVIIGLNVSNIIGNQINIDLRVDKAIGDDVYLVKGIPIPNGSSFEFNAGNKFVLQTGDSIKIISDTAASVDVLISVLEQT
tara:strand:- start:1251 stop:1577 length:327 start_codon:yes stop_codon:yes gene_type:complete